MNRQVRIESERPAFGMTKAEFLELLTKALEDVPDDALVTSFGSSMSYQPGFWEPGPALILHLAPASERKEPTPQT